MQEEKHLYELIEKIYEAGMDPEAWQSALPAIIEWAGFDTGSIAIWNTDMSRANIVITSGMGDKFLKELNEYYIHINKFAEPMHRHIPVGGVYDFRQLISWDSLKKDQYYNESMVPEGMHYDMGVVMDKGELLGANMPLQRHRRRGAPGQEERNRLERLAPHITRAYQLNARFWQLRSKLRTFESMLEQLRTGVLILGTEGQVLHVNTHAEHLLAAFPHLQIRNGRLQATTAEDSAALAQAVDAAVQTGIGRGTAAGKTVTLRDPRTGGYVFIQTIPLCVDHGPLLKVPGQSAAVVFLSAPAAAPVVSPDVLMDVFALTPAEADLARMLAKGTRLQQYAAGKRVQIGTVRNQLKTIFQKIGVHTQADLVRLLNILPGIYDQ